MRFPISRLRILWSRRSARVWSLVAVAACVHFPVLANAQQRNAKEGDKDETKNPGFFHHVTWCSRKADELQSEYDAAMQAYADAQARYDAASKALAADAAKHPNYHGDDYDPDNPTPQDVARDQAAMAAALAEMDALRADIAALRKEWNTIRGDCGLQGDIGAGPPQSSNSGAGGGGSSAGGGGGGGASGGGGSSPGGGTGGGGGKGRGTTVALLLDWGAFQKLARDTAKAHGSKGIGVLLARDFAAEAQIERSLAEVQNPPVRTDSLGVVGSEKPNSLEVPADFSPIARSGLDGVAFLDRELADLHNYVVDYGRYRGAVQAKDTAAEREEMTAMASTAMDAIDVAASAAAKLSDTDKQLLELLGTVLRPGANAPGPFNPSINPDLDQELRSAALPPSDLAALNDSLRNRKPADLKTDVTGATGRLAADSAVLQKLSDKRSFAKWPTRPEQFALDRAAATSDNIKSASFAGDVDQGSGGFGRSAKVIALLAALVIIVGAAIYWLRTRRRFT